MNHCYWKSCSFRFSCVINDTICWNNILAYHQFWYILFSSENSQILKEKTIFKNCSFFGQACFLHLWKWVCAYDIYIFPSCDSMNYKLIKNYNLSMVAQYMHRASFDHASWTSTTCLVNMQPVLTYWELDMSYAFGCG